MKIHTSRFGEVELNDQDIINFPEGILGFENCKRFFVIDPSDGSLVLWLQSVSDPDVAFPIIEPEIFKPNYTPDLMPSDIRTLELDHVKDAKVYTVLTIPVDVTKMSANLKAPIIINSKKNSGRQIVLQDNKLEVKYEMYQELRQALLSSRQFSDDTRRTAATTRKTTTDSSKTNTNTRARNRELDI